MFSFKELMVDPVEEGNDEYLKYRAQRRRRGVLESLELDEAKKDHFVYQKDVTKTKEVVHRGTEQSSKEWIEKNAKHYSHKGRGFDIYKGTYPNVKPSDKIKYSYVAESVNEMFDKVHPTLKKELGSHAAHAVGMAGSDKGVAISFDRPKDINALKKQMSQHGYKNVTPVGSHKNTYHFSEAVELDEALSTAARLKKGRNMKRYASRMAMGRKKALKKTAGRAKIKQRAERQARNAMFKKLTKGIPRSDLTPARRAEIEKRMDKMKGRIQKQAVKLMPVVRKMEKDRKSRR
tara:strand:+ start:43778 stop:44650 length:873 start_codon:yes stop_codon:yes gene_type:complete